MRRHQHDSTDHLGIALVGAAAFGAGLVFGLVSGGLFGEVGPNRVRRAVGRLRSTDDEATDDDPAGAEQDLLRTLQDNPATRGLGLEVHALPGGLVEITGSAPDETTRELAGELARGIVGSALVVNRVLVEGVETDQKATGTQ